MKKIGVLFLIIVLLLASGWLFFEEKFIQILGQVNNGQKTEKVDKTIRIAYLFSPVNLNPYSGDTSAQNRLNDVYESLVKFSDSLSIEPALAVSYGMNSDLEWEFDLRQGVKFHDGSNLKVEDVVYSLNQAKKSNLAEYLENFDDFEVINQRKLVIKTFKSDPLLLNKLTKIAIVPDQYTNFDKPNGTGAYILNESDNLKWLKYQRNEGYWGMKPYYKYLEIKSIADKGSRIQAILNDEIDFLADVPPDAMDQLKDEGFYTAAVPSLEIGFAMFNFNDKYFSKLNLRKSISLAIDKNAFLDLAKGYAKTINQFIPNGVFGYNPDILSSPLDLTMAKELFAKEISSFEKIKIDFYFPQNLKLLGQYFKDQLGQIGFDVNAIALSDQDLQDKLVKGELSFYYLGWKSDLGDGLPFIKNVLHSSEGEQGGKFNGMNYKNKKIDQLIDLAENSLDLAERLKAMQDIMKIAVDEDIVGIPLFETESLFAYKSVIQFKPRVDSVIYPSKLNEVSI